MTLSLEERLNQILPRITSRDFLDSKGLGNEIGFWVFDYPPERELDVRNFVAGTVLPALAKQSKAIPTCRRQPPSPPRSSAPPTSLPKATWKPRPMLRHLSPNSGQSC